ncbi:MAG: hypothetical protein AAGA96_02745 [Verrucomicrobiota bacterium]
MKLKHLLLLLPILSLAFLVPSAEAGHRYSGYYGGYGIGYGSYRSYGSRHYSPSYYHHNRIRGYYRDSGHTNYQAYRLQRHHELRSKQVVPSTRPVTRSSRKSIGLFKKGIFR